MPDAGHVLAVVVAHQGKHPRDHLREAALWHGAGHDTDCLALVGRGQALPHEAVQVRVFLTLVKVEMAQADPVSPSQMLHNLSSACTSLNSHAISRRSPKKRPLTPSTSGLLVSQTAVSAA